MTNAKMALALTAFLILGAIVALKNPLIARNPPAKEKNNVIEVPKGTPLPDDKQIFIYHKKDDWHLCRFNGFIFVEPLVLLKGEPGGMLLKEVDTAGSREVEHRGVYVKLQIAPKAYANEADAKKGIKDQKFDQLDEIIIPMEQFKSSAFVTPMPDKE
ncbi:MAG: hypothetical protein J0I06_10975 [Planctomycetes bacterium]|nr:hypothetical protein [Planctomycetota bacterium]